MVEDLNLQTEEVSSFKLPPDEKVRVLKLPFRLPEKIRTLLDGFKWAIHYKNQSAVVIVDGRSGMGKCQVKGSKVLMSDGTWKNIEDIRNGDEIISPQKDGSFIHSKVSGVTDWFCDEVYDIKSRVTGEKLYSCSYNHLIPTNISRTKRNGKNKRDYFRKIENIEARDLFNHHGNGQSSKFSLFSSPKVEYKNRKDSSIDPYSLGVFLGDGSFSSNGKSSRQINITSADYEIIERVSQKYHVMKIYSRQNNKSKLYRFSLNSDFSKELSRLKLEGVGSGSKFIPEECLMSSIDYRTKLLEGLIDTDGNVEKFNTIRYTTKSKRLAEDISKLVFSLGGRAHSKRITKKLKNIPRNYFDVVISFKDARFLNIIKRKKDRIRKQTHDPRNITVKIEKGQSQRVYGFELDSPSKWYVTDNWMVTHNTTISFQMAAYMSPNFSIENVHFTPESFLNGLTTLNKGDTIVFDEAMLLSSRAALTQINRMIVQAMSMIRSKNIFVIFNVNSIFDLDRNLALSRADVLFNCYGESLTDRGKVMAFFKGGDGRDRIKDLYLNGKKFYSYSSPKSNFNTTFSRYFVLDEQEYERRKQIGVNNFLKGTKSTREGRKWLTQRDLLLQWAHNEIGITATKLAEIIKIDISSVARAIKGEEGE